MDWGVAAIAFICMVILSVGTGVTFWLLARPRKRANQLHERMKSDAMKNALANIELQKAKLEEVKATGEKDPFVLGEYHARVAEADLAYLKLFRAQLEENDTQARSLTDTDSVSRSSHVVVVSSSQRSSDSSTPRRTSDSPGIGTNQYEIVVSATPRIVSGEHAQPDTASSVQPLWIYNLGPTYHNRKWLACVAGFSFVLVVGLLLVPLDARQVPVLLIAVGFGGAFARMASRLSWLCPNPQCNSHLHAKQPWQCGFCRHINHTQALFERCGNSTCRRVPKAFVCPACGTIMFLDRDNDSRNPAMGDIYAVRSIPHVANAVGDVRRTEIETLEHQKRTLALKLEVAQLEAKAKPVQRAPRDPRQDRMEQLLRQLEEAEDDCLTIQESVTREKRCYAQIDADSDLTEAQKLQAKAMVNRKFEAVRISLGGDIELYDKGTR
jgi:hypothetical protein